MLAAIKQSNENPINGKVLSLLIANLKTISHPKILKQLVGLALTEKQRHPEFDISSLIQILFTEVFGKSHQLLAEFLVKLALESKSAIKQVFALISLSQMQRSVRFTPQIQLFLILTIIQSPSKVVRDHGLRLAQGFCQ